MRLLHSGHAGERLGSVTSTPRSRRARRTRRHERQSLPLHRLPGDRALDHGSGVARRLGRGVGTEQGDPAVSSIIGGAMLPHAPQFFTMPETEDRATVERVRAVAAYIGTRLRELKPDLWILFSNDHAEQFFHHVAPPFTFHVGGE